MRVRDIRSVPTVKGVPLWLSGRWAVGVTVALSTLQMSVCGGGLCIRKVLIVFRLQVTCSPLTEIWRLCGECVCVRACVCVCVCVCDCEPVGCC